VIAGKLRHLVKLPGLMIEAGDAAKKQGWAVAVAIINFVPFLSGHGHSCFLFNLINNRFTRKLRGDLIYIHRHS
jgi:hypothetical protein